MAEIGPSYPADWEGFDVTEFATPFLFTGPGKLPTKGRPDDAGFDLYTHGLHRVIGHEFVDVDCGVAMELPVGYWAMIVNRSSTIRKRGLLIVQGIIDCGYRGPLFAAVQNMDRWPKDILDGERIAQILIFPNVSEHWKPTKVAALSESERGTRGFGSTGS